MVALYPPPSSLTLLVKEDNFLIMVLQRLFFKEKLVLQRLFFLKKNRHGNILFFLIFEKTLLMKNIIPLLSSFGYYMLGWYTAYYRITNEPIKLQGKKYS